MLFPLKECGLTIERVGALFYRFFYKLIQIDTKTTQTQHITSHHIDVVYYRQFSIWKKIILKYAVIIYIFQIPIRIHGQKCNHKVIRIL
jgi:hypothetical protein